MKIDGECLIKLIGSCRNKVQVYRSVRMPQLHTSLHFHLTPIVMINDSSHRDLLLNSQNFCHSIPMLSVVIRSALGYPAFTVGTIISTPEVCLSKSSHTKERSSQSYNAHTGYGLNCDSTTSTPTCSPTNPCSFSRATDEDDPKRAEFWLENTIRVFDELSCTPAECVKCVVSLLKDSTYQLWNTLVSMVPRERLDWEFLQTEF
ncbi:hypothetical protein Gotri_012533 [Gossypium trilobum]|uniref:Uncharacterized protein n=1 Tax=Gossypium trilobum TaxID=34281 RepID=A0A7J9DQH0_9ROSI|nr:hypothetical protein [Gossypium trilobum]